MGAGPFLWGGMAICRAVLRQFRGNRLPIHEAAFKGGLFGQMRRSSPAFCQHVGKGGRTLAQSPLDVGELATHLDDKILDA